MKCVRGDTRGRIEPTRELLECQSHILSLRHEPARYNTKGQFEYMKTATTQHTIAFCLSCMMNSLYALDSLSLAVSVPRLSKPTKALTFNLLTFYLLRLHIEFQHTHGFPRRSQTTACFLSRQPKSKNSVSRVVPFNLSKSLATPSDRVKANKTSLSGNGLTDKARRDDLAERKKERKLLEDMLAMSDRGGLSAEQALAL